MATFDASGAAYSRASRRLAVPVHITCTDCGKSCRDAAGQVRTTTDRAKREDFCDQCKAFHGLTRGF